MKGEGLNRFVQAQLSQDSSGMGALHTVCCSTGIELLLNACNSEDQREKEHHAANECWPAPGWSPRAAVILLPVCAGHRTVLPQAFTGAHILALCVLKGAETQAAVLHQGALDVPRLAVRVCCLCGRHLSHKNLAKKRKKQLSRMPTARSCAIPAHDKRLCTGGWQFKGWVTAISKP